MSVKTELYVPNKHGLNESIKKWQAEMNRKSVDTYDGE